MLQSLSSGWAKLELYCAGLCAGLVTALILLNVVTRTADVAIFWVDEAAIYSMIWMTMFAASAAFHYRNAVSVTIVRDALPEKAARLLNIVVDCVAVLFAIAMCYFCLRWFDPVGLIRSGFDTQLFQSTTFNFIYAEPTTTLGIRKIWVWLVMAVFTFGILLHSISNLVMSLSGKASARGDGAPAA